MRPLLIAAACLFLAGCIPGADACRKAGGVMVRAVGGYACVKSIKLDESR